jgi:hypothetical protein
MRYRHFGRCSVLHSAIQQPLLSSGRIDIFLECHSPAPRSTSKVHVFSWCVLQCQGTADRSSVERSAAAVVLPVQCHHRHAECAVQQDAGGSAEGHCQRGQPGMHYMPMHELCPLATHCVTLRCITCFTPPGVAANDMLIGGNHIAGCAWAQQCCTGRSFGPSSSGHCMRYSCSSIHIALTMLAAVCRLPAAVQVVHVAGAACVPVHCCVLGDAPEQGEQQ